MRQVPAAGPVEPYGTFLFELADETGRVRDRFTWSGFYVCAADLLAARCTLYGAARVTVTQTEAWL